MGNFTKISFKNIDGWIPESDADGVDLNQNVASDISVFRYKNGFLENDLDAEVISLPSNVATLVASGYTVKSIHKFSHSEQGDGTVYILWKSTASTIYKLRIYLDNTDIQLLDDRDLITAVTEPNNINYNLVNDELKINLNCTATLNGTSVILNLSLQYLEEIEYNDSIRRDAGWYLCPRWLGWNYPEEYNFLEEVSITESEISESFSSFPITSVTNFVTYNFSNGVGKISLYTPSLKIGYFYFRNDKGLPLSISVSSYGATIIGENGRQSGFKVLCYYGDSLVGEADHPHSTITTTQEDEFTIPVSMRENNKTFKFVFSSYDGQSYIYVTDFTLTYTEMDEEEFENGNGVLIAKYYNGERALLGNIITGHGTCKIALDIDNIDWRISSYEVYSIYADTSTYVLYGAFDVDEPNTWILNTSVNFVERSIGLVFSDNSLDFRYNLPYDSRVDNQSLIYSEVSYKGRIYFAKEDFKVYQSHIAGNGIIQPDSFPYDEEQGFGYFVVSRTRKNIALAVSPTNDLVIFTDNTMYVYQIQPSGSTVYRRLLMVSGSIGLSSRSSLARSEEGNPSTSGLIWADNNGIYYYAGGVENPTNLLLPTHSEYWRYISSSVKSSAVGFYDAIRQEYVLYLSTGILLTYELPYKKFRKSEFSAVSEVVGLEDNIQYYRNGNNLYKFIDNSYQIAYIISHYNSGYTEDQYGRSYKADEIDDKILQELYVVLGSETDEEAQITVSIYFDGHLHTVVYTVDATKQYWKIPMPILRFRRVKIKIAVNNAKRVILRDFGITTTEDTREALGVHS